jgi:Rrf2 family iron-sulfur cluster assembly transcriptional regulator
MRLSTRGRFAINAMIDLALRQPHCPVPLSDLALRHGISLSYLEQVFAKLRQHGLVESTRGPGGGYTLGFRGDAITVADIVTAIEESAPSPQESDAPGADGPTDMTHALWEQLHTALMEHMKTISLRSLALQQRAKGFAVQERKSIRFVVVGDRVAQRLHGRNHLSLARISLAGGMAFDGAHGHALVRDLVVLAPGGQRGQQAAVDVRGVYAEVTAHLLKVNDSNAR